MWYALGETSLLLLNAKMARAKHKNPSRPATISPKPQPQLQQRQNEIISQQWSGPLPPPAALDQFNQIIPGGAERILAMVEQEQTHRITHNTQALLAQINDTKRGQILGSLISLLAVGGSIFSVYIGAHPTVSIALVSIPVVAMVEAVVRGRNSKK
jgi:uncharacterized membrane protein